MDGTGKTTIALRLDAELDSKIKTSLMTSSPFDMPLGKTLKQILLDPCNDLDWQTELLLFGALFRNHHNAFTSHVTEGMVNICDRGYLSAAVYQFLNGADIDSIWHTVDLAYDDTFFNNTDIIILDTDNINTGLGRTEMDRFTYKGEEYYTKVRDRYREFDIETYTHIINSDRPLDDVYYDVKEIVVDRLREKFLLNE